jgi:predicted dehydrogenase
VAYRCAILGCGPRAHGHAAAYRQISRGELVAICDADPERLQAFGDQYGVAARYQDLGTMLAEQKPDLVNCITNPHLRVELLTRLEQAGVPAVLVEKPVCTGARDYKALRALAQRGACRVAVNHQLRHHPLILDLLEEVQTGAIGQVRMLDASAVLPMSGQGVHVLDLIFAFNGYAPARTVFGASSGYDDINGFHPSPRTAETFITFDNGVRALLQAGAGAPEFIEGPDWMHKRIAVYGTHGFRHWWMSGFERSLPDGSVEKGGNDYGAQDVLGQANLTNAVLEWLDDEANVAPTNLTASLDEWLVILAGYLSTIEARPVALPFDPPDDLLERFRAFVGAHA